MVIPRGEASAQVFVERRDGQAYFFVMVHPRLPREPKVLPRRLLIAWDASASARGRDLTRELDLLDAYVKRLGTCRVNLAVFRNEAEPLKSFPIQAGDARAGDGKQAGKAAGNGTSGSGKSEGILVAEVVLLLLVGRLLGVRAQRLGDPSRAVREGSSWPAR